MQQLDSDIDFWQYEAMFGMPPPAAQFGNQTSASHAPKPAMSPYRPLPRPNSKREDVQQQRQQQQIRAGMTGARLPSAPGMKHVKFSEQIPEKVQDLSRMFLHDGREGNTFSWADNVDRSVFQSDDVMYEFLENENRRSVSMEPTADGVEVYSVPRDYPDITLDEAKYGYENRVLAKKGWVLESHNDLSKNSVWVNETTGEAKLMFWYHGQGPTEKQDNNLVFRDIPLNRERGIVRHTQFSDAARQQVESTVEALRGRGFDVEFTGYSRGGYAAAKYGAEMNIDVDTLNAHIMPYNRFESTEARISHHTTANDRTNFKYTGGDAITSDSFASHEHTIYGGQEGATGIFESHAVDQFHGRNVDLEYGYKRFNAMGDEPIETGANAALNVLQFTDAAFDTAEGNYKQAAQSAAVAGISIAAPVVGQEIAATQLARAAVSDWKTGNKGMAALRGGEAAALAVSPALGISGFLAAGEGVAAIEQSMQANQWRNQGNKNMAALVGTEAALNTLGAAANVVPGLGNAASLGLGGLAMLVHVAERAEIHREKADLQKQIDKLNDDYTEIRKQNSENATYGHSGGVMTEGRVGDAATMGRDISKNMGIFELPR